LLVLFQVQLIWRVRYTLRVPLIEHVCVWRVFVFRPFQLFPPTFVKETVCSLVSVT
jgi:hypothetical protein